MNYLKAMRDALEALEHVDKMYADGRISNWDWFKERRKANIAQLRAAIEAWEKEEPAAWLGSRLVTCEPALVESKKKEGFIFFPLYIRKDEE